MAREMTPLIIVFNKKSAHNNGLSVFGLQLGVFIGMFFNGG